MEGKDNGNEYKLEEMDYGFFSTQTLSFYSLTDWRRERKAFTDGEKTIPFHHSLRFGLFKHDLLGEDEVIL